ncbi:hypothetical protein IRJ41_005473, partial [Triplophysa rosa]
MRRCDPHWDSMAVAVAQATTEAWPGPVAMVVSWGTVDIHRSLSFVFFPIAAGERIRSMMTQATVCQAGLGICQ